MNGFFKKLVVGLVGFGILSSHPIHAGNESFGFGVALTASIITTLAGITTFYKIGKMAGKAENTPERSEEKTHAIIAGSVTVVSGTFAAVALLNVINNMLTLSF